MYCINCGKEIDDKSKFCRYCGTSVKETSGLEETVDSNHIKNEEKQQEKKVPHKKKNWLGYLLTAVMIVTLYCLGYWGIYKVNGDLQRHTDPISALCAVKCGLNEEMDFGDFSLYFDEEISGTKEYRIGNSGYKIEPTDDEKQLCGLAGVIAVTNGEYVFLGNIDISMQFNGWDILYNVEPHAVKTDAGEYSTEKISSLMKSESAYIMYGGADFGEPHVKKAILYYKDSKGKRHLYYVEP